MNKEKAIKAIGLVAVVFVGGYLAIWAYDRSVGIPVVGKKA